MIQTMYIHIYIIIIVSSNVYKNKDTSPVGQGLPPTLYKMGINYPVQNGLASLYKYKTRHSWCPQRSPSGPLSVGSTPPTMGPPGLRGSRPVITRRAISAR
jgi:hypothetical protein